MNYLTKERKQEIFNEFGGSEKNTGSAEGQVAMITERITHLTGHLKKNRKDHATTRSLVKMVGQRKRLLKYIASKDIQNYRNLIEKLGLRR